MSCTKNMWRAPGQDVDGRGKRDTVWVQESEQCRFKLFQADDVAETSHARFENVKDKGWIEPSGVKTQTWRGDKVTR